MCTWGGSEDVAVNVHHWCLAISDTCDFPSRQLSPDDVPGGVETLRRADQLHADHRLSNLRPFVHGRLARLRAADLRAMARAAGLRGENFWSKRELVGLLVDRDTEVARLDAIRRGDARVVP